MNLFYALSNVLKQDYFETEFSCRNTLHRVFTKHPEYRKYSAINTYLVPDLDVTVANNSMAVDKISDDLYTVEMNLSSNIRYFFDNLSCSDCNTIDKIYTERRQKNNGQTENSLGKVEKRAIISIIKQVYGNWEYRCDLVEVKINLDDCEYLDNNTDNSEDSTPDRPTEKVLTEEKFRYSEYFEDFVDKSNGYND